MIWIYLFEDCDMCHATGKCPGIVDGKMIEDATCPVCQGRARTKTNMSFALPYNVVYPSGIDEEMAAGGGKSTSGEEPWFP